MPRATNATARETYAMNPVALLTPTYGRDLELCTLLCESVDRHVKSFSKHYLLVPDCDLSLFSHFDSQHRVVLPASQFLPAWLRPLLRIIQRKRDVTGAPISEAVADELVSLLAASGSHPAEALRKLAETLVLARSLVPAEERRRGSDDHTDHRAA